MMADTVKSLAAEARWKLHSILRTKRFMNGLQLVDVYKAQLLSFMEYRTPAIYHTCDTALFMLDSIQDQLLKAAGFNKLEALLVCNLAPLAARRDIALLGLIHRTMLGKGPSQFREFFVRSESDGKHRLQLKEYMSGHATDFVYPNSQPAQYIQRSALRLTSVYNRLPKDIVERCGTVSSFQTALQDLLKNQAMHIPNWECTFSPRIALQHHPLNDIV